MRPFHPALIALIAAAPAAAAIPDTGVARVLIDARLQERPVTLLALDTGQVTYADAGGLVRTEPVGAFVALAPPPGTPMPPAPLPAVWLVDGQRFAGAIRSGETHAERVLWKHPTLGGLAIAMDDAARIILRKPKRGTPAPATETEDVITLVNGDRLAGFLDSFGPTVRIEVEGQLREVSARRVAEVALANPARPATGLTAWLGDGSVVRAAAIRTSPLGEVTLTPSIVDWTEADDEGRSTLSLDDVVAIAFDASRLVPLAALEPAAQRALGDRRWTEPVERRGMGTAVLGAADIVLPGPMRVEWDLPRGASRLAGEVELTPDLWTWGDCEFVVSLVNAQGREVELQRDRVSAERARVTINVPITEAGARLRLTLEPGRYGSIQDRLIFRRPLILLTPTRE